MHVENIKGDAVLIGSSAVMQSVRALVAQVAQTSATVLITGPSGCGKEVVAQLIHQQSRRDTARFVPVNCGAIPADLLESELFGHEKGAFTGAINTREGRFEAADGGTLFLDEIGDMPLNMQVKLLRVLEERRIERVGSNKSRLVDVRIVSATHRDLGLAIQCNQFREDLFYRLNIFPIRLPSLAERSGDIPELLGYFLKKHAGSHASVTFDDAALQQLVAYDWPGNVRELRNFVERAAILYPGYTINAGQVSLILRLGRDTYVPEPEQATIHATPQEPLPISGDNIVPIGIAKLKASDTSTAYNPAEAVAEGDVDLRELLADLERSFICAALAKCQYVVADAARLLRLQRTTLIEKMRKYDIGRAA
jgi:sigma-54 dependent transcriptional regulator, flagellar regulatory protein